MNQRTEKLKEEALERMRQVAEQSAAPEPVVAPHFDPYPTIHQSVIQPIGDVAHQTAPYQPPQPPQTKESEKAPSTSDSVVSAGIINLANNPDLSIETIAHEAKRLQTRAANESDEVVISLR